MFMCHNCIKQFLIALLSLILVESAIKDARFDHSSAIIKDRLYILGGSTTPDLSHASSDIFYLDLKNSFNTFNPTWIGITSNLVNELTLASATTSKDYIILFGGESNGVKNNPINVFDVSVQQWINPTIRGEEPGSRIGVDIVSGEGNKVYIYGGNKYSDSGQYIWFEELRILNALDFSWEPMIPGEPRALYTSVLLHGGVIAFIGGYVRKVENGQFSRSLVEMNEITLFNTFEAKWYKEIAGGEIIEKRHSHSAVITSDGRVIIYGGSSDNLRMVMPVLAVLKTESFEWSVPVQMFGPDLPPPLTRHTADLYMNYMIVAFGNITNELTPPTSTNSYIYMLDTNNYQWITSYSYSNVSTSTIPPQRKSDISAGLIVGVVSAGIAFTIIIIIAGVFIHRKIWNRSDGVIPTPGSNEYGNTAIRNSIVTVDDSNIDINNINRYSVATDASASQVSNFRMSRPISTVYIPNTSPHPSR